MDKAKPFPIQGGYNWGRDPSSHPVVRYDPCTIPWWLAEVAYQVYASKFGEVQSLERLAERGGFGREELVWLLSEKSNSPIRCTTKEEPS